MTVAAQRASAIQPKVAASRTTILLLIAITAAGGTLRLAYIDTKGLLTIEETK
jgi:hypothetical protein